MQSSRPRFVTDTHTLWWHLETPELLSANAAAIFRLAESGAATIIVPAIVVAEFYYLSVKQGKPMPPAVLLADLASSGWAEVPHLGPEQLVLLDQLSEVPEMHDRMIAAAAVYHKAPILTRDPDLVASPQLQTIW